MEAITRVVTVRDNLITAKLPEGYNNKPVGLIILKAAEGPPGDASAPGWL